MSLLRSVKLKCSVDVTTCCQICKLMEIEVGLAVFESGHSEVVIRKVNQDP
jgi:hypothetical protein